MLPPGTGRSNRPCIPVSTSCPPRRRFVACDHAADTRAAAPATGSGPRRAAHPSLKPAYREGLRGHRAQRGRVDPEPGPERAALPLPGGPGAAAPVDGRHCARQDPGADPGGTDARVKDVDFERNQITVRAGKGAKDRVTMLPAAAARDLAKHLEAVRDM